MKRIPLLVLVLFIFLPSIILAQAPGSEGANRRILVSGEGSVEVEPTIASIQLGVDSFAPLAKDAVASNHSVMQRVIAALRSRGIKDKDLKTSGYYVGYEQADRLANAAGEAGQRAQYRVSNSVSIVARDLAGLGALVDAAMDAGATNLYGITFGADDTAASEKKSRAQAMKAARERADELATLANVRVGRVIRISETGGVMGVMASLRPRMLMDGIAGGTNFDPGQVAITVRVEVEYELE